MDKHLSAAFPIRNCLKQGDALSPMLFYFALECVISSFQENKEGFELKGTHQLLVYADDVNLLSGNINTERNHNTKTGTGSKLHANVTNFEYLRTTGTN
jgi:hypothetical protein